MKISPFVQNPSHIKNPEPTSTPASTPHKTGGDSSEALARIERAIREETLKRERERTAGEREERAAKQLMLEEEYRGATAEAQMKEYLRDEAKAKADDSKDQVNLDDYLKVAEDLINNPKAQIDSELDKAKAQVGFIPNMYKNMANLPALLDTYLHGYALFREEGGFTPVEQEVVFLAISHENHCEYCVSAHSMLAAKMSGVPEDAIAALRNGSEVADEKLAALDRFTRGLVRSRGNPSRKEIAAFTAAGYTEEHVLAVVLALSVKILSNYSNHLFNSELDPMFSEFAWPE